MVAYIGWLENGTFKHATLYNGFVVRFSHQDATLIRKGAGIITERIAAAAAEVIAHRP